MKNLVIVRHAKSSWDDSSLADFDRPLNKRGLRDAPYMGKVLSDKDFKPDLIISSPANRAFTTAKFIAEKMGYNIEKIRTEENIYSSSAAAIVKIIRSVDDSVGNLALFGHNPDITYLSSLLTGNIFDNVPTCGMVGIRFDVDQWKLINEENGKMVFFEYPKKYFKK